MGNSCQKEEAAKRRQSVIKEVQRQTSADAQQTVYLNVYSLITSEGKKGTLSREALEVFGVGINHSAVVIFGEEWSFGGGGGGGPDDTGIFTVAPTTAEGCLFRESIELGKVTITREAFDAIIDKMTPDWKALSYHLMTHNCNCFTYALTGLIYPTLLYKFPSYVNRVALSASTVVPESVVNALMDTPS